MSDTEYTPTDSELRDWVVVVDTLGGHFGESTQRFDRWLAQHDAAVRADERKRCLENSVWRDTIEEQRAYITSLTEQLAAAQAVIVEALRLDDNDQPRNIINHVLSQPTTDALQAVKAEAWDEAIYHLEANIGSALRRAAMADNPYRKGKTNE